MRTAKCWRRRARQPTRASPRWARVTFRMPRQVFSLRALKCKIRCVNVRSPPMFYVASTHSPHHHIRERYHSRIFSLEKLAPIFGVRRVSEE